MKLAPILSTLCLTASLSTGALPYRVVDTGQSTFYDNSRSIAPPKPGQPFHGQDAGYSGNKPAYRDNGDGTVSDLVSGLMWQQDPGAKMSWSQAAAGAPKCRLAGHSDWRLPTIKELYSLILFSGLDPDPMAASSSSLKPFIDSSVFRFEYGDTAGGERVIDSQFATSTQYVSTTMHGNQTMFGVNFADGRIKGYPTGMSHGRRQKTYHVLYVRGNPDYGRNDFHDNGDRTVSDRATGLSWMKIDSGHLKAGPNKDGGLNWQQALEWAEDLEFAGHSDWRLPNAKELQSILDYTRSPDTTDSAAIDPLFECSEIKNEAGKKDYPYYWSGSTHARGRGGSAAAYFAFGRSPGWMRSPRAPNSEPDLLDVHGAGSQRSDPKAGDASRYPQGRGPQGDVIRILNHVRCVRGGNVAEVATLPAGQTPRHPAAQDPPSNPPPSPTPPSNPHFLHLDRNKDGQVSRSEFDGPPLAFGHHDRDGDGFLSPNEFPKGPPR